MYIKNTPCWTDSENSILKAFGIDFIADYVNGMTPLDLENWKCRFELLKRLKLRNVSATVSNCTLIENE